MRIADLVIAMDRLAPLGFAEPWDNVGLLLGDPEAALEGILVCVDLAPDVMDEAVSLGANAVVAYHPPLFRAVKRVVAGDLAFEALRRGLAVHSPHTALDAALGGTNDVLANSLGLVRTVPLRGAGGDAGSAVEGVGIGRVGELPSGLGRSALAAHVKAALGLPHVLVAGPEEGEVKRIAVCAGAGGALLDDVVRQRAEAYVVGELSHHEALRAAREGVTVVCTLHSNTERGALAPLATSLRAALSVAVTVSTIDRDPFRIA